MMSAPFDGTRETNQAGERVDSTKEAWSQIEEIAKQYEAYPHRFTPWSHEALAICLVDINQRLQRVENILRGSDGR